MNDQQIIRWLWRFGHFRNPANPNTSNVTEADLPNLTLKHPLVKAAIASIQALDENANQAAFRFHARAIIPDGDIGPATRELFTIPRCACPDYADATTESADATGSGPWPVPGCDPTRKNRAAEHSIRINVNTAGMPYTNAELAEIILKARRCAAEFGLAARYVLNGNPREAEQDISFASLAEDEASNLLPQDAVIGRNYFPQAGTCNQTIQGWISRSWYPSSNRMVLLPCLWVHEQLGHGVGLQHTRGGIMNPSILPVNPLTWRGDPHEDTMRRWYGGVPVPLDDQPTPIPAPLIGIPGEMTGRRLDDGTYAVDGVIGPIPADAVGKYFIVQRIGNTPVHRLIPKSEL